MLPVSAVVLLLALALVGAGLLPGASEARRGRKAPATRAIVVRDYTSDLWSGVVAQTVADFNAIMPEGGPVLRYARMDPVPCESLRPSRTRRVIAVCSGTFLTPAGQTSPDVRDIWLSDPFRQALLDSGQGPHTGPTGLVCHEMMHVLTGIQDNTGARLHESCVWGILRHPGPFDIATLAERYPPRHP